MVNFYYWKKARFKKNKNFYFLIKIGVLTKNQYMFIKEKLGIIGT